MLPCTGEEKHITVQADELLSPCYQMLVVQLTPRDAFHKIQSLSEQHSLLPLKCDKKKKTVTSTHLSLKSYHLRIKKKKVTSPTDGAQLKGQG